MPVKVSEPPVNRVKGNKYGNFVDLIDAEKGNVGFVIGNGWSCSFYDTNKMREAGGILIGCNEGFKLHKLHYLTWQDGKVNHKCAQFDGIKICSNRTLKRKDPLDPETTFLYEYGSPKGGGVYGMYKMHSGGLALQIAVHLGLDPIFLVGCDCCIFQQGKVYKTNMFRDRQGSRVQNSPSAYPVKVNGKLTTPLLRGFAQRFNSLKQKMKRKPDIYRMGDFGILEYPFKDFKEFWSTEHPGVTRGRKQSR
jgi:hypothetical protein